MHANALTKIEKQVEGSLRNCHVVDSWPQYESFRIHVESLSSEILKHKKAWLTNIDIFSIFYDLVYQALQDKEEKNKKLEGNLSDLLGDSDTEKLKQTLVEYFKSIPRKYDIYLPLPSLSVKLSTVVLNDNLALVIFGDADAIPGGNGEALFSLGRKLDRNKPYLRYSIEGYCSRYLESYSPRTALSIFKIMLQQGISRSLLKVNDRESRGLGLFLASTHYQVPKAKLVCIDKTSDAKWVSSNELSIDMSRLLDRIDINLSDKNIVSFIENGKSNEIVAAFLKYPSILIENKEIEATRVKSAIEWCFDSYATENQTMAFIQICIGLEALFGDEVGAESITNTLADRCAYLVGGDIKGRKTIREKFKQLYSVRSKLVHGLQMSLTTDDQHYLDWGRVILEHSILKEIKHLNLDKPA